MRFFDAAQESSPRYYGWLVVALTFTTMAIGGSIVSTFPIFYVTFLDEFGWSRADTALAFSTSMVTFAIAAGPIGALIDRFGPRVVIPSGVVVLGLGLTLMSMVSSRFSLYLYYGVFVALGVTLIGMIPTSTIVSHWFVRMRSTALGIAHSGRSAGSMVLVPLCAFLIAWVGWRSAYLFLAAGIVSILLPLNLFLHRNPPQREEIERSGDSPSPQSWTLARALRDRAFWLLFFSGIFQGISFSVVGVHMVAHMVDVGLTTIMAAWLLGFMAILRAVGGIGGGWVGDLVGRRSVFVVSSLISVLGVVCLMFITSDRWALGYLFVFLYGIGAGARGTSFVSLKADIFPGKSFGRILGFSQMGAGLASGFGPWLAGYIFDVMGSYRWAFFLVLAMNLMSIVTGMIATRRAAHPGRAK
ncbi:MAG: MFS transporter [Nitrospinaceae bacterium]|nr:MFS transporter [Nitrospinaceae bacterium]MBT3434171.1 MFS transporter [Nitrospinaceae bacterium]MBT3821163.1 MFS transporter [Nitrospinaceae bacterium]MBT4094062.1 MFS transporter [Nitrospinaceae bacterium]MBT4432108.1 MFS transporter [Nitrospinaceae bacterium]